MKKIIYLFVAVVVFCSSCKKKEETKTNPPASDAVVSSVSQVPGETHTYSYDSEGRLQTIQNSGGSHTDISYSGDTVTEKNYNDSGIVVSLKVLFLNTSGLAIISYLKDTSGNMFSHSSYAYDGNNFMIEERDYDVFNNQIAQKEWSISSDDVYYYRSTDSLVLQNNFQIGYSYSFERDNTTGNENMGMKYYGKSSKNVMKTQTKESNTSGNAYYTYQYTFDGSGRVATQTAYNHQSQLLYTNTYTYN